MLFTHMKLNLDLLSEIEVFFFFSADSGSNPLFPVPSSYDSSLRSRIPSGCGSIRLARIGERRVSAKKTAKWNQPHPPGRLSFSVPPEFTSGACRAFAPRSIKHFGCAKVLCRAEKAETDRCLERSTIRDLFDRPLEVTWKSRGPAPVRLSQMHRVQGSDLATRRWPRLIRCMRQVDVRQSG
jgi:hypothetical protein